MGVEDRGSSFLIRAPAQGRKEDWPVYNDDWAISMESNERPNAFEALEDLWVKLRFDELYQ